MSDASRKSIFSKSIPYGNGYLRQVRIRLFGLLLHSTSLLWQPTYPADVLLRDAFPRAPEIATYLEVKCQTMALSSMLAIAATITLLGAPAIAEPALHCESNVGSPDNLKELKHGLVEGYLPPNSLPNSLELLSPPPNASSTAYSLDVETAEATFPLRGKPRWDLAARDADLNFPAAASIYSCALGVPISKKETPRLYTLLHRTAHRCRSGHLQSQKSLPTTATLHGEQPAHVHTSD